MNAPMVGRRHVEHGAELEAHARTAAAVGDLAKAIAELAPRVIGVQTVVADSSGQASVSYRLPYQAISVDSFSANQLTVTNSAPQTQAPGAGPGTALIRPNGFAVINFRAYVWSLYGAAPGDLITVTAFASPQNPMAGLGALNGGTP